MASSTSTDTYLSRPRVLSLEIRLGTDRAAAMLWRRIPFDDNRIQATRRLKLPILTRLRPTRPPPFHHRTPSAAYALGISHHLPQESQTRAKNLASFAEYLLRPGTVCARTCTTTVLGALPASESLETSTSALPNLHLPRKHPGDFLSAPGIPGCGVLENAAKRVGNMTISRFGGMPRRRREHAELFFRPSESRCGGAE